MASKFLREYRIVVVGAGGTGKTCITVQFVNRHFVDEYDPTLEDSYRKQVVIDDEMALADVLDTAGQEEYSAMREQYMRTGEGFILVYSITSRDSFDEMKTFHKQILQVKKENSWPMILVGNKNDLSTERQVSTEEGIALAQSFGCSFLETSAKRRHNIDETFLEVIRAIRVSSGHTKKEEKKGMFARSKQTRRPTDHNEATPRHCLSGCSGCSGCSVM